jgi:hypothetical protein
MSNTPTPRRNVPGAPLSTALPNAPNRTSPTIGPARSAMKTAMNMRATTASRTENNDAAW